jgi:hypothetical protein
VFLTLFPPAFYSNPLYPYCRWRLSPLTSQCHQGPARQGVVKHFLSGKRRPHCYAWSPMKLTATERDRLARMRARPCKHGHLRHTPGSAPGCVLFVKLWQFDLKDRTPVRLDAQALAYTNAQGRPGVEIAPLFNDSREEVRMELWAPNTLVTLDLPDGGEFLVLDGAFDESGESFTMHSWLRLPPQGRLSAAVGRDGCALWVKTGHLQHLQVPPRTGE